MEIKHIFVLGGTREGKLYSSMFEHVIDILDIEAKSTVAEKTRHRGTDLEHYFNGREAGILFALDHIKNLLNKCQKDRPGSPVS